MKDELEKYPKVKEAFEKWYIEYIREQREDYNNRFSNEQILRKFYRSIFSMQWGVWVDFCDSKGLGVDVSKTYLFEDMKYIASVGEDEIEESSWFKFYETRPEALQEVFRQSLIMLNNKL